MSEFTRELIPILFMYGCVLLLGPFIGFAMWMAFDGDSVREPGATAATPVADAAPPVLSDAA